MLELPPAWIDALGRAETCRRVAVLGPTDAGKSSFIHALAERAPQRCVIDVDPGQKMIGPPATASLGRVGPERRLERFVFLGSTTGVSFRALADAAAALARGAVRGFIANTSGYVGGPGPRMQAMVLDALAPDLVVAIAPGPWLEPVLRGRDSVRVERSPAARRKTESERKAVRQSAFEEALRGAETLHLPSLQPTPGLPQRFEGLERPVCAIADATGEDRSIGILTGWREGEAAILARPVARARTLKLGKLWARSDDHGAWRLIDRHAPAWAPR